MDDQLKAWTLLAALPGMGPMTTQRWLAKYHSPTPLLDSERWHLHTRYLSSEAVAALQSYHSGMSATHKVNLVERLEHVERWLLPPENRLVPLCSSDYPELLKQIPDPPPLLFVTGNLEALHRPQLAMVGSRQATSAGVRHAEKFAAFLANAGWVVTSGLAAGIDAAAHAGVVSQCQPTIAVMGTGPDVIYPKKQTALVEQILANDGAIVSELWPATAPLAKNFPKRNRIISGLSCGVLVVEASPRSGSLITARMAMEQGREVFAIPGSIDHPGSRGCHQLIKQGAVLTDGVDDIATHLAALLSFFDRSSATPQRTQVAPQAELALVVEGEKTTPNEPEIDPNLPPEQQALVAMIDFEGIKLDQLVLLSGMKFAQLNAILVELELFGVVERRGELIIRCANNFIDQ